MPQADAEPEAAGGELISAAPQLPAVSDSGEVYKHIGGKYMGLVDYAIDHMGDADGLTPQEAFLAWAQTAKGDFYTKIAPKFIPKHLEIEGTLSVERMLEQLDASDRATPIEGTHRVVSEGD